MSGDTPLENDDETIFVSIPSYRDPECKATLSDLFLKAAHPKRVFVGICYQLLLRSTDEPLDWSHLSPFQKTSDLEVLQSTESFEHDQYKACWFVPDNGDNRLLDLNGDSYTPRVSQVRFVVLRSQDARGPCLARHLAHKLYRGEKYQMSIDSHMRFEANWDEIAINQLKACNGIVENIEKCIITTYPASYELPNKILYESRPIAMVAKGFGAQDKMLRMIGKLVKDPFEKPHISPFWAAGFNFSFAKVLREVPYDPTLDFLFFGEECSMIVRLYTNGYRFVAPTTNFIYHLWSRSGRPSFREVKTSGREQMEQKSLMKVQEMLGIIHRSDSTSEYGLGSVSSLSDYESFSGVSFSTQSFKERAQYGLLTPSQFALSPEEQIMSLLAQLKT
eukprot:TRINITY_DN9615_c0_g1_i1.p1 TRINITY_DN9615_c0_g1~~TRINITY_DN9615_c0_g1_i1.p1  ORF type:complete len:391 (-),score=43.52 TRINITY_DN9615_c0_g1_i1:44-1216(-)